jgi:uncharacterized protein
MQPEFVALIRPYLENETYKELSNYRHHNTTRLNHLYNVAIYSYAIGKTLDKVCNVDFNALIAGALLHDFHFVHQDEYKILHCRNTHGMIASKNAVRVFDISDKERNIIEAHMFPMVRVVPRSKEAWIVSFSDKFSAIMEACFSVNHSVPDIEIA